MPDFRVVETSNHQPYSAAQERHEHTDTIAYVAEYIRSKGYSTQVGVGNGFIPEVQDLTTFERKSHMRNFYAWDYISAGDILEKDRITPNQNFPKVRQAIAIALDILRTNYARKR